MPSSDQGQIAQDAADTRSKQTRYAMGQVGQAFSGYTPAWYQDVADTYTKDAMPQLQEQYGSTRDQLGFKLANQGLDKSGAGQKLGTSLANELSKQKQNVVDQSQGAANSLQQQVENYRQQMVGQVEQAVDPAATAQSMLGSAANFQAPAMSTANMFGDWSNMYLLANQAYNRAQQPATNVYNTDSAPMLDAPQGYGSSFSNVA